MNKRNDNALRTIRWSLLGIGFMLWAGLLIGCEAAPKTRPEVFVFHATWCHNCPTIQDIDRLANDYPDFLIVNVDVDEHPDLWGKVCKKYAQKGVPFYVIVTERDYDCAYTTDSFADLEQALRGD